MGVLQQRVVDAETKLLKHRELLWETERNIVELDDTIADVRRRIWPSPWVSPRIQSVGEEMFSATEDQESSDDPTRGLGRWFKGGFKNLVSQCRWKRSWLKLRTASQEPELCALLENCPETLVELRTIRIYVLERKLYRCLCKQNFRKMRYRRYRAQ